MTDYDILLKMLLSLEDPKLIVEAKENDAIELFNEVTLHFKGDGTLWWIANERYQEHKY